MIINSIGFKYNSQAIQKQNQQTNPIKYNVNFLSSVRVDKSMARFYEFNFGRFPDTVMNFLNTLADKFQYSPIETQKRAFIRLNEANNIQDIKERLFPQEKLFENLKDINETNATNGILGIYREFKDLYDNGILKSGEDLSVYLLKKIFLEAKTIDEINLDMDEDLNTDVKAEFQRRNEDSNYIHGSTLKALGIQLPDTAYWNSLKFTREGYSDEFGIKISQGQLKYWNSLTDEQKFEILSKRCEGRDNWWNSLTRDEKLELAANVDSEEDLYRNYKRFVRASKKEIQEGTYQQELERPTKKIKVGKANLKDKDIFNLWFRKNLEKFYSHLSEADKDVVHIKRVRKLTVRWQEMTPEERTELINKMREGREPLRYAMIDAWNNSAELIKELSEFLASQQILKPVDLLYSTQEFSEFQSKVMTEFWAEHEDLAEEFGKSLHSAIEKVENSIQKGQFEDLKQEIMRNRAYRIKLINAEKERKAQALKSAQVEPQEPLTDVPGTDYRKEFKIAYRAETDPNHILPTSYINDMTDIMIESFPQESIKQLTSCFKYKLPVEVKCNEIPPRALRFQRALEAAIANEMCARGADPELYSLPAEQLVGIYGKKMREQLPQQQRPNVQKIEKLYDEYKKDLSEQLLKKIRNQYFIFYDDKGNIEENNKALMNYIESYGRSALILFSEKSAFPNEVKMMFNEKFLRFMPNKVQEICVPVFRSPEDIIEERDIQEIKTAVAKKYEFMPEDFLTLYTQEVAHAIRCHRIFDGPNKEFYSIRNYKEKMCKRSDSDQKDRTPIVLQKYILRNDTKMKFLAAEQALADEIFKITQNEAVYSLCLEELCNAFEIFSGGSNFIQIDVNNGDQLRLFAQGKPSRSSLQAKYKEYLNELQDRAEDILGEDDIKDKTELMYCLNPVEGNSERDKYVLKRIEEYIY